MAVKIKNGIDIMKQILQKKPRTVSPPFSATACLQVGHASAVTAKTNAAIRQMTNGFEFLKTFWNMFKPSQPKNKMLRKF
jgi:hypothetical protein